MTKVTYTEISTLLRETSEVCIGIRGSYSYVTGAYESIIAGIVADLPSHKQAEVMRTLKMLREHICS